jgi:hypothetical protein
VQQRQQQQYGTAGTSGAHGGSGGGAAGTSGGGARRGPRHDGRGRHGAAAAFAPTRYRRCKLRAIDTHHVVIAASTLNMTTAQTINTDVQLAHMHAVTLEPADLADVEGRPSVTITSSVASAHTHVFTISCH